MATWRAAALLLVVNVIVFAVGIALAGSSAGVNRGSPTSSGRGPAR
jgi:hypothetical protein